ncbi:MAG: hypothetical protein VKM97_04285 [Cyanobacteriota bacterium]|nr:hypothetical protein [Cyanobacteriota bacterium]
MKYLLQLRLCYNYDYVGAAPAGIHDSFPGAAAGLTPEERRTRDIMWAEADKYRSELGLAAHWKLDGSHAQPGDLDYERFKAVYVHVRDTHLRQCQQDIETSSRQLRRVREERRQRQGQESTGAEPLTQDEIRYFKKEEDKLVKSMKTTLTSLEGYRAWVLAAGDGAPAPYTWEEVAGLQRGVFPWVASAQPSTAEASVAAGIHALPHHRLTNELQRTQEEIGRLQKQSRCLVRSYEHRIERFGIAVEDATTAEGAAATPADRRHMCGIKLAVQALRDEEMAVQQEALALFAKNPGLFTRAPTT